MMNKLILLFIGFILFSCIDETKKVPNNFKNGYFKTVLKDRETVSFANRNDSIQIETYKDKKDTFNIKWVDNFEYILIKTNPKSELDSTPFHVKITGVKENSYTFKAQYKGSNFKQTGEVFKIK